MSLLFFIALSTQDLYSGAIYDLRFKCTDTKGFWL